LGTTGTIKLINKELGMSETSRVRVFEGIRERKDGSLQEVRVEVLDAGKRAKARRYAVNLRFAGEAGRNDVVGEPAPTLKGALSNAKACLG
jgi:hypothetical protein